MLRLLAMRVVALLCPLILSMVRHVLATTTASSGPASATIAAPATSSSVAIAATTVGAPSAPGPAAAAASTTAALANTPSTTATRLHRH